MAYSTIKVNTDTRGVVDLCLNRPQARNAMSGEMISELADFAATLGRAPATRAVVLRGAGEVFCAGADLGWMKSQIEADPETRRTEARKLAMALKALNEMPVPLVGRIHRGAFGGGVGLACICDVVVAERDTKFGLTETKLGLIPATISPYVLARMGEGMARRVFMSSRVFDVSEARTLGIVAKVVEARDMDAAVEAEVAPYLAVAPGAVGRSKALARFLGPRIDDQVINETIDRLVETWEGKEAADGIAAFLDKTIPPWS
ncbi:MAG: crotonase/enoyl-CoA hydratase family protein [Silicimonas sp.]|nr:crotonase/enoyl-CoA hydratase family protein [Silicimonas sp.]